MDENYLAEIEERVERATPGPWESYVEGRDHTSGDSFIMTGREDLYLSSYGPARVEDQDFIAHARQDIPALINEVKRLNALTRQR